MTSYDFYDVNADMVYDLFVPKGAKLPATYHGVPIPEGGCVGESDRVVGTFDETPAGRIDTQNWERMKKDPRVLAADRSWSACMKTKGYAVGNPYDALNLAFSSQGIQLSREISMAVADVACKTSTGLVTVYFSVETQLQNQAIKAQRSRLDAADYGQQLIGLYRVFEKYEAPLRNTA
ncbi:hypothetical protein OG565_14255 [Streptomyces sp. NBC_00138]|uniref:hypothetical protein n=1 Tax=Streptomyces sp. NBC_00138 TaxID=2903625 RepID=UPI00324CB23D